MVATASDSLYTLTLLNSEGVKEISGLFTAVSGSGTAYSGSWALSGNVVTGTSSGAFSFTLTISPDGTTGSIDYVTEEGSGTAAATRIGSIASDCSQYAGDWAGSWAGLPCDDISNEELTSGSWVGIFRSDCTASLVFSGSDTTSIEMAIDGSTISGTLPGGDGCMDGENGTLIISAALSGSSLSGTFMIQTVQATWSGTKE